MMEPGGPGGSSRRYVIAGPVEGQSGAKTLDDAVNGLSCTGDGLIGFFGVRGGHLPFATADGSFNPTFDIKGTESYTEAELHQNPSLAEMTSAAITVLSGQQQSCPRDAGPAAFYLMVEAGDVDWANHANNLDNSIGAVLSGDAAVAAAFDWIEANDVWDESVVIVTADHGHFLVIDDVKTIRSGGE